jgi:hypothetical protein
VVASADDDADLFHDLSSTLIFIIFRAAASTFFCGRGRGRTRAPALR